MGQTVSVLDLPSAWLVQLAWELDSATRISLFCTCKGFRDLVFGNADSTSLTLQPLAVQQPQMLKAMQMAHQHAKAMAVCMHQKQQRKDKAQKESWAQHARQLTECSCSLLHQAQLLGYLDRVTKLEFTGAELPMPLMPVFSESCPNLTSLTLHDSNITWEGVTADSFSTGFTKLQNLHLHNVSGNAPNVACQQGLQQQVAQLTGLTSLQLLQDGVTAGTQAPLYHAIAAALTPTIVGQLVQFALPVCKVPIPATWQWKFGHFKHLQELRLEFTSLDDALMQQLLPLPNLKSVSVLGIKLEQSYRGQPCRWQQLITDMLRAPSVARLPLHSTLKLQGPPKKSILLMESEQHEDDVRGIQQAKCNIITSKWGGWAGAHVALILDLDKEPGMLLQFLSMLGGVGGLSLVDTTLTEGNITALGNFICSQQQGFVLDLSFSCTYTMADLAVLVSCLPAGSSLVVRLIEEADVIQLCSAAQRSFALRARRMKDVHSASTAHVEAALAHMGGVFVRAAIKPEITPGPARRDEFDWVVVVNPSHSASTGGAHTHRDSVSWALSLQAHLGPFELRFKPPQ